MQERAVAAALQGVPPGEGVTVYPVMADPPLEEGADHETTDWESAFDVAETPVGAPGAMTVGFGVTLAKDAEPTLFPLRLVATTVKV